MKKQNQDNDKTPSNRISNKDKKFLFQRELIEWLGDDGVKHFQNKHTHVSTTPNQLKNMIIKLKIFERFEMGLKDHQLVKMGYAKATISDNRAEYNGLKSRGVYRSSGNE